jgi:dihydroorotase
MRLLIKNGLVIEPKDEINEVLDILVEDGKISRIEKNIKTNNIDELIDASGRIVMPGIVDMHVHLREPGREDKETVDIATQAAIKGGVTTFLSMPNTSPCMDCRKNVKLLKKIIKDKAKINVFICGAITKGRKGKELTDISGLKKEGIKAISDDGASVDNDRLMLKALKSAKKEKILVISHCEDKNLSSGGMVNLGGISTRMGLRGISKESEYKRIERDIYLADKAKAAIHITHGSCKESVDIIREAKKKGIRVTCDTAPHYFSLTEEAVLGYNTNAKMSPPLRTREDFYYNPILLLRLKRNSAVRCHRSPLSPSF